MNVGVIEREMDDSRVIGVGMCGSSDRMNMAEVGICMYDLSLGVVYGMVSPLVIRNDENNRTNNNNLNDTLVVGMLVCVLFKTLVLEKEEKKLTVKPFTFTYNYCYSCIGISRGIGDTYR